MLGILVTEVGERVDSIAWFGHTKLHITGPEVEMICDRKLDHSQSVKLVDQGLLLFEGILGADHKPYFVQVSAIIEDIGNDQVSDMDRIEASKVKSNLHLYFAKNSDTKVTAS